MAIVRQGNKPAKITVSRGDEKWEADDGELDKLPETAHHGAGMFGGGPSSFTLGPGRESGGRLQGLPDLAQPQKTINVMPQPGAPQAPRRRRPDQRRRDRLDARAVDPEAMMRRFDEFDRRLEQFSRLRGPRDGARDPMPKMRRPGAGRRGANAPRPGSPRPMPQDPRDRGTPRDDPTASARGRDVATCTGGRSKPDRWDRASRRVLLAQVLAVPAVPPPTVRSDQVDPAEPRRFPSPELKWMMLPPEFEMAAMPSPTLFEALLLVTALLLDADKTIPRPAAAHHGVLAKFFTCRAAGWISKMPFMPFPLAMLLLKALKIP